MFIKSYKICSIVRLFEVENVLLHTFKVKRNVGQGTPTKIPTLKGLLRQSLFYTRKEQNYEILPI